MWIFGYGSLVWRPGFAFEEAWVARLDGFARRFWQGSPDHRGTPERPGRVVTLVEAPGETCVGRVFRVDEATYARTMGQLDHREQGGYARHRVELRVGGDRRVGATIYVASPQNPHFLGPAPIDVMVEHIATSVGPSGRNAEYLLELARWLEAHGVHDAHVAELAERLRART